METGSLRAIFACPTIRRGSKVQTAWKRFNSFHVLSTSASYHHRAHLISIITDLAAMLQFW
jgi:hypothetical protein